MPPQPYHVAPSCAAVVGVLKGYDQLLNLVMDEATEFLRGGQHSNYPLLGLSASATLALAGGAEAHWHSSPVLHSGCWLCAWQARGISAAKELDREVAGRMGAAGLCTPNLMSNRCLAVDPEDPLRVTDQTRFLGLVVSPKQSLSHSNCCMRAPGIPCIMRRDVGRYSQSEMVVMCSLLQAASWLSEAQQGLHCWQCCTALQ